MKKSYSEQICELCGIKPYYGIYVNFGDLDSNYKLVTSKRKYKLIANYRWMVDNEDELRNLEAKYLPDFENNNNNFVKLFNLKYTEYDEDTVAEFVLSRYKNIINTRSFLGCILFELQHGKYKDIEKIKQAIRETNWEY